MRRKPVCHLRCSNGRHAHGAICQLSELARSAGHLGATRADVEDKVAPDFTLQSIDGEDRSAFGFSREGSAAEFLGNLLCAL